MFGYQYGLEAGQNPYPNMKTSVFSRSLKLPPERSVYLADNSPLEYVKRLKSDATGPIYLCGGGEFAGWLAKHGLIDKLRLKRAPIILGQGTKLFGEYDQVVSLVVSDTKLHENGLLYQEFKIS